MRKLMLLRVVICLLFSCGTALALTQRVYWQVSTFAQPAIVATTPGVPCPNSGNTGCSFTISAQAGTTVVWGIQWKYSGTAPVLSVPSSTNGSCALSPGTGTNNAGFVIAICSIINTASTTITMNWSGTISQGSASGIIDVSNLASPADEGAGVTSSGYQQYPSVATLQSQYSAAGRNDFNYGVGWSAGSAVGGETNIENYNGVQSIYSLAADATKQSMSWNMPGGGYAWLAFTTLRAASSPPPLPIAGYPSVGQISNTAAVNVPIMPLTAKMSNGAPFAGTISVFDPMSLTKVVESDTIYGKSFMLETARQLTSADNAAPDNITVTATQNGQQTQWTMALTVAPTTIVGINPDPSVNPIHIYDNAPINAAVAHYNCRTNDGTTCRATFSSLDLPNYMTLLTNGLLRPNRAITSADDNANAVWHVQATATSAGTSAQCPTAPPEPAQSAGFLAQQYCWDWTAAIPNTIGSGIPGTPTSTGGLDQWLGCNGSDGYASDLYEHVFYEPWGPPGGGIDYCNRTWNGMNVESQQLDPTYGNLAFMSAFGPADQQQAGFYSPVSYASVRGLPGLWSTLSNDFPTASYVEYTFRSNEDQTTPFVQGGNGSSVFDFFLWGLCNTGWNLGGPFCNHGQMEDDLLEIWSRYSTPTSPGGYADSIFRSDCYAPDCIYDGYGDLGLPFPFSAGGVVQRGYGLITGPDPNWLPPYPGFDWNQYHTVAHLTTTDGANTVITCLYIDNALVPTDRSSSDPNFPCVTTTTAALPPGPYLNGTGGGTVAARRTWTFWNGGNIGMYPNQCPNGSGVYSTACLAMPSDGAILSYIKSIRVYTCGGGVGHSTGSGSNPNCFGLPSVVFRGPKGETFYRVTQQ